jgi:aminoglycoside/choline kinase family phosphotransferase
MVMHDHPEFNSVGVNQDDFVVAFAPDAANSSGTRKLAFTGIHILEREVLRYLPARGFAGIIEAYKLMLDERRPIKAMIASDHYWNDIGSPERYRRAAFDHMAPLAFEKAFGQAPGVTVNEQALHGDGSDRRWYRLTCDDKRLIMADHGIRIASPPQEADAYVAIGRHLRYRGIPVPRIVLDDTFSGLVFMEDLGDQHLQSAVLGCSNKDTLDLYERVIGHWATMAVEGADGFDTAWTYQTPCYDRLLILEKEARYFCEAFLQQYLNRDISFETLADEFESLADATMDHGVTGFMHRDFQSRNIMVHHDGIFFIDFQGGRLGPVQYDLASLLIDPYTALPFDLQARLRRHGASILHRRYGVDEVRFIKGYDCCAVTRNLQILGAFAFLSRTKGKTAFEAYIPRALTCLTANLNRLSEPALPRLRALAENLTP